MRKYIRLKGIIQNTIKGGTIYHYVPGAFLGETSGTGLFEVLRELEDTDDDKLLEDPPISLLSLLSL